MQYQCLNYQKHCLWIDYFLKHDIPGKQKSVSMAFQCFKTRHSLSFVHPLFSPSKWFQQKSLVGQASKLCKQRTPTKKTKKHALLNVPTDRMQTSWLFYWCGQRFELRTFCQTVTASCQIEINEIIKSGTSLRSDHSPTFLSAAILNTQDCI